MRFPRLAHGSAAAHTLHSTPQQHRMNLISGNDETSSRLPAFSLFLPGSCPNNRDRRTFASGATLVGLICMDAREQIQIAKNRGRDGGSSNLTAAPRIGALRLVMLQRRQRLAHRRRPELVADRRQGRDARREEIAIVFDNGVEFAEERGDFFVG
jgi:hypothetical protein